MSRGRRRTGGPINRIRARKHDLLLIPRWDKDKFVQDTHQKKARADVLKKKTGRNIENYMETNQQPHKQTKKTTSPKTQ